MDLAPMAALLRKLTPRQEKVIRLYFGLGCQRPHSAPEVAQQFGVSVPVIAGIIGAAQRRLRQEGLTSRHLREAARQESELHERSAVVSLRESIGKFRGGSHSHHQV